LTLGYSRKSVRLLTFESSTRRWAELHEESFRRLGGAVRLIVKGAQTRVHAAAW
jgi:transposase